MEYVPVIDPKYPVQTIANTLLLDCDRVPEAKISLTVIGSDKKNSTILVPVRKLIALQRVKDVCLISDMRKRKMVNCKEACSYIIRNWDMIMC